MRQFIHKHTISFVHAFDGVKWAFSTQPNFRVHLVLSALTLMAGWFFEIGHIEFLVIVFTILLGLVTEMLNTAIEAVTDLVTTEWRAEAKIAKDVSAGMMLLVAFGALIVLVVIFMPYVITAIS